MLLPVITGDACILNTAIRIVGLDNVIHLRNCEKKENIYVIDHLTSKMKIRVYMHTLMIYVKNMVYFNDVNDVIFLLTRQLLCEENIVLQMFVNIINYCYCL